MSGGKGGSSSSGSSSNYGSSTTTLPDWLTAGSQQAVSTAESLANRPYTPYQGQLIADVPQDTMAAYQDVRNMQGMTDPSFNAAQGSWGGVLGNLQNLTPQQIQGLTNQLYGGYTGNVTAPAAGLLSPYMGQGPATAGQVGANAMTLMSPYEQAVVNPALKLGSQALAQNLQTIGAGANQAGAFGGTRQGVMEGVAQSQAALNMAQYGGNLLAQGYNAALTPASQVALQGGQQAYGGATGLVNLLGQGYGTAGQQAQSIAGTNLGLGTQAAQQIPSLALQQASEAQKEASMMQTIGAAQQNQQQALINSQLGQYYEAQNWPVQNLDILTSALGSVPYGSTTTGWNIGNTANQSRNWNTSLNLGSILGSALSGASAGGFGGAVSGGILGMMGQGQ